MHPFREKSRSSRQEKLRDMVNHGARDQYTRAESMSKDSGSLDTTREMSPIEKSSLTESEQKSFLGAKKD